MRAIWKSASRFLLAALLLTEGAAQQPGGVARTESLRVQLVDLMARETELQNRLQQLEEDMRPENIQRSIALIGTLRPEELREQRRQQLEKERANVTAQLDALAASRGRLESSIATAEAEAARQQAGVPESETTTTAAGANERNPVVSRNVTGNTGVVPRRKRRTTPRARRQPRARRRVMR